jgi:hypothetical protein
LSGLATQLHSHWVLVLLAVIVALCLLLLLLLYQLKHLLGCGINPMFTVTGHGSVHRAAV